MSSPSSPASPVKVLWTGGWDSTFQVLRLLLEDKRLVQPVYMIDENRRSLRHELMAMRQIKTALAERFPHTRELMLPFEFHSMRDIVIPPDLHESFLVVSKTFDIRTQYEYLAAYSIEHGIHGMQLCVHKEDNSHLVVQEMYKTREDPTNPLGVHIRKVYGHFDYPILEFTKPEMAQYGRERGWEDFMEMTWFCQRPVDGEPCGLCRPCHFTIIEGMAHRVPAHRRIRTGVKALDPHALRLAQYTYRLTRRFYHPRRPGATGL